MEYLKKREMYTILTSLVDKELKLLKDASYKFYHGTEWIEVASKDLDNKYKMFKYGNSITLNQYRYDENTGSYAEINRTVYQNRNGEWVQIYNRNKTYESVRAVSDEFNKNNRTNDNRKPRRR